MYLYIAFLKVLWHSTWEDNKILLALVDFVCLANSM